ncbi:PH domain-containing protein [Butyrivibrio proteoclasticus]|uniref:PH domain-containing protein n=1 Tax=Butyrivibrio proteoclasticus TaxID=43305 RepID=A0A1I5X622_9FIRM|nr:PH domain-containing protein [Butyrivibrio proteoclasticus]SFQ27443.1 PH domain-containing protein [Butyrivibrio proteoclasticus]
MSPRIANPEKYEESKMSKGELRYTERSRWLLFGLPWTFTKYEIRDNDFTIINGFFTVRENDCYMYKISDVEITRTLLQRIAGLSTITLFTSDVTDRTITMKNIKHGREIKDFLLQASEAARIKRRTVSMQNIGFGAGDIHDADDSDDLSGHIDN